jgi:hypothetical protein
MRKCENWLQTYIRYTSGQESPERFHLWCGISVLAVALERRVWVDRGFYTLFPNLYIILTSGSAIARKSTAIHHAVKLLRTALPDINFISQRITPQALITEFGVQYKKTGVSSAYIVADELALFLGTSLQDATLVHVLTKAYTSDEICDYHTIARGKEVCNNMCVNLLGGTTPEWVKDSLPPYATAGGFAGRILFIFQPGPGKKVAYPSLTEEQKGWREDLISDLSEISKLQGAFRMDKEAIEMFETWYNDVFNPDGQDIYLKGYYGRKHDTLLKVAMIRSVSLGDSMTITGEDIELSLKLINQNEKFLPGVMQRIHSTAFGDEQGVVLAAIERRQGEKGVSYSDLLRALSYRINAKQLQETLRGLAGGEMIVERVEGRNTFYKIGKAPLA